MTTVSGHHRAPWAISLVIRWRGTAQSGTFGAVILDVRMGSPPEESRPPTAGGCLAVNLGSHQYLRVVKRNESFAPIDHPTPVVPAAHHTISMKVPATWRLRFEQAQLAGAGDRLMA